MSKKILFLIASLLITALNITAAEPEGEKQLSESQKAFQKLKFGIFLHFNMATFFPVEWASGYEDPLKFTPSKLDCEQWADAAKSIGMKYAVLTVKHTGGWCLWPSDATKHDTEQFKNFKDGKGDIVKEFVDAFRKKGLK